MPLTVPADHGCTSDERKLMYPVLVIVILVRSFALINVAHQNAYENGQQTAGPTPNK